MDKHTKKKLLSSYQKTFFYFIVSYTWSEKNNRKKNEVFDRKGCCCDYNMYFCNRVIMKFFV